MNSKTIELPAGVDRHLAQQYAGYVAGLRQKLARVSKSRVGSAAKASRAYFAAELESVQTILDADRSEKEGKFDDQTRRMFEYRWYWVANELGLETGPEPDGLVALGYGHLRAAP